MPRTPAALLLLFSVLALGAPARADEPERREDAASSTNEGGEPALSLLGGRTLAKGRRTVTGMVGWPGVAVGGYGSPSDGFDIGLIAQLAYSSPFMGFPIGLGFDLSVPMRIHLFHAGSTDMALTVTPRAFVGRAELIGARGSHDVQDDVGLGIGGEVGLRLGHRLNTKMTLAWGVSGSVDHWMVPRIDAGNVGGSLTGMLGLESLLTRATLFFVKVEAGYGFAPDSLFDTHAVFRGVVGFAHTRYD